MKEEICRFAVKMASDAFSQVKLVAPMSQRPVCKKFRNKSAFDLKMNCGVYLKNPTPEQKEGLAKWFEEME